MKRRRIGAAAARCAGTLNLFEDLEQPGCAAPAAGPPSDDPDERTEPDPDPSPLAVDRAVEAAGLRAEALSRGSGPDRFRGEPLSPHAAAVTASADVAGRRLRLPGTLPRDVYEELAEAFKRIGGRWVRRGSKREDGAPAGFFEFPEESEDLVQAVITTGRKPPKNPTSLFPSPPEVVDRIIELADLGAATLAGEYRFLEPHAGRGAIADRIRALFPTCPLDLIEILDLNLHVLRRKGYAPIAGDFLHFDPGPVYDRILANPPFSLSGAPLAYQEHIRHAWQLLSSRGILVSVIPAYIPRAGSDARAFERWIADRGEIEELPAGSFRSSGTNVATGLICLDKRSAGWKRQPFCGWGS